MPRAVDSGVNAFNAVSVGGTSTALQMFPAINPNFTAGGVTSLPAAVSTTVPLLCNIPANGQFEMQRFKVVASGKFFVHGTSPTQVWKMYNGTSMTPSSNTAILTMSALTGLTTNAWYPWSWQSEFQGDTSSGILQAINSTLWVDNATAGTITLTGATSVNFQSAGPVNISGPGYTTTTSNNAALNLSMAFQETVSDAKNICYCAQFYIYVD